MWSGKPTPGAALMNLRFRDERGAGAGAAAGPASELAGAAGSGSRPAVAAPVRPGSTSCPSREQVDVSGVVRVAQWVREPVCKKLGSMALSRKCALQLGGRTGLEHSGL